MRAKYIILILILIAALLCSCGSDDPLAAETAAENENVKEEDTIVTTTKAPEKSAPILLTVYNIKEPAAGNYPQSLYKYPYKQGTAASENFTQTLEWFPAVEKTFEKDTQYTAVLTLEPKSAAGIFDGVQLENIKGLPENNTADMFADIIDGSMIIKIIFEKTASLNAEPELLFYDDFEGDKLDNRKWEICPNWDRQGRSTWTSDMVSVGGGYLRLGFARDEALGESKTNTSSLARNWLRSGAIRTRTRDHNNMLFENSFGYYEARIKIPQVRGMWGAFWLMSLTQGVLGDAGVIGTEIDIFESIHNERGQYNAALHWDGYGSEHKSTGSGDEKKPADIYDGEFHTFALDWSPGGYIFYVDGIEFWRCDGGPDYNNSGVNQNPNYIKLSVEGAEWAGTLPADFTEGEMLVDYVRVYNQPKYK